MNQASSERQRRAEEYFLAREADDAAVGSDPDVSGSSPDAAPGASPDASSPAAETGPARAGDEDHEPVTRWRTPREIATYAAYAGGVAAVLLGLGYGTDFPLVVWLGWVAAAVAASVTLLATVAGGVRLGMHHALLDAEERRVGRPGR